MPSLTRWGERAVSVVAIGAVFTLFVNVADSRYAIADDFLKLKSSLHSREIRDMEDKITIIEDNLYVIEQEEVLTNRDRAQVSRLENRKAKYLRRLEDIKIPRY